MSYDQHVEWNRFHWKFILKGKFFVKKLFWVGKIFPNFFEREKLFLRVEKNSQKFLFFSHKKFDENRTKTRNNYRSFHGTWNVLNKAHCLLCNFHSKHFQILNSFFLPFVLSFSFERKEEKKFLILKCCQMCLPHIWICVYNFYIESNLHSQT